MTYLLNNYNFMDLLKEKGHVPTQQDISIINEIENSLSELAEFVEETATDYNFMDLLHDKGYGRNVTLIASNDNGQISQQAS